MNPAECLEPPGSEPSIIVIFGASGDLTKRKLLPSLYNLATYGLLSPNTAIVGVARRESSNEAFRDELTEEIKQFGTQKIDPALWEKFRERTARWRPRTKTAGGESSSRNRSDGICRQPGP